MRLLSAAQSISLAAVLFFGACGGGQSELETAPLTFSGAPAEVVPSASGAANISVRWSWSPPVVGYDAGELTITDTTGAAVTGLALTIVPWMPAHGHGASVAPTVSETSAGVYVAAPLDFFMSGQWELITTMTGPINDTATPSVEIP
jgi:hypothetical protein